MKTHYLSIYNRETTVINNNGITDPTTSLLKVEGELSPVVQAAAKFIVTDGILVKRKEGSLYPKGKMYEALSNEQLELLELNYSRTTTKQFDTSEKIEAILA